MQGILYNLYLSQSTGENKGRVSGRKLSRILSRVKSFFEYSHLQRKLQNSLLEVS